MFAQHIRGNGAGKGATVLEGSPPWGQATHTRAPHSGYWHSSRSTDPQGARQAVMWGRQAGSHMQLGQLRLEDMGEIQAQMLAMVRIK